MWPKQDLCLAVIVLLAITSVGQALPMSGRVVNGTDSSVEKYPFVISGDSGGPLLSEGQQVGIVSWSIKPCTVAPYHGVYFKVSQYIDWIKSNQIVLA